MKKVIGLSTREDFLTFKTLMKRYGINPDDLFEADITAKRIIIRPSKLHCALCGAPEENNLISRNGILICEDCINEMEIFKGRMGGADHV